MPQTRHKIHSFSSKADRHYNFSPRKNIFPVKLHSKRIHDRNRKNAQVKPQNKRVKRNQNKRSYLFIDFDLHIFQGQLQKRDISKVFYRANKFQK